MSSSLIRLSRRSMFLTKTRSPTQPNQTCFCCAGTSWLTNPYFFSDNNTAREITQIGFRVRRRSLRSNNTSSDRIFAFLRTVRNSLASFLGVLSHNCVTFHKSVGLDGSYKWSKNNLRTNSLDLKWKKINSLGEVLHFPTNPNAWWRFAIIWKESNRRSHCPLAFPS